MDGINDSLDWRGLKLTQEEIISWQKANFPDCQEWELALGVCEEAGELAQCVLKLHRGMRADEFSEERLKDAIGDIIVYLIGICEVHGWQIGDVIKATSEIVLKRKW